MIAGSGFTITQTGAELLRNAISTTSTTLERLAEAMYTVTITTQLAAEAINALTWPEIWQAWWDYVKRLTLSKSSRSKRPARRPPVTPIAPTEYG